MVMENRYDKYKDSGIAWIGEIPEHWDKNKIIRLFSIIGSGTTPKSSKEDNYIGSVNWIQSGDINGGYIENCKNTISDTALKEYPTLKIYKAPFIIVAMYGASVGNISISNIDGCVNQACCVMNETKQNFKYLFYAMNSVKRYLIYKAEGGGQPNISQDKIKNTWMPIPPFEEQQSIATYLDQKCGEIDELITLQEEMITKLQSYKQSVITEAVTKGLDKNVSLKDSGIEWIGEIPEHWKITKIQYLAQLKSGYNLTTEEIKDSGLYPVYGGNGIRGYYDKYFLEGDYVLIGRQGALCGNINYSTGKSWATEHAVVCYPKTKYITKWFGELLRVMNLNQYSLAAAQPGLAVERIKLLPIPIIPLSEQQSIANYLDQKCSD